VTDLDRVQQAVDAAFGQAEGPPRRLFVDVPPAELRGVVHRLRDRWQVRHVSTITGLDNGTDLEVLYHLARGGAVVTLRVTVPRDRPEVPSIVDLIPGAAWYEREVRDLLGVEPAGNPDPGRLVLTEDWPRGIYPLRKDWPPGPARAAGEEEAEG